MPAVTSAILVNIIAGEFSTETQYHPLKHDAVPSVAVKAQIAYFSVKSARESTSDQAATVREGAGHSQQLN